MRIIQVLLGAILIVQAYVVFRPQTGRFVSSEPGSGVILDTSTGHWCAASPKLASQVMPECQR
ncbi:MAG: hypothetical protein WAL52_05670 [Candidatus Sulfotelmatobacter sp.]